METGRHRVTVVNVYGTNRRWYGWDRTDPSGRVQPAELAAFRELYQDQLPRLLPPPEPAPVTLSRPVAGVDLVDSRVKLYTLPSNQVVVSVACEFATGALPRPEAVAGLAQALERCLSAELAVGGEDLDDYVARVELPGRFAAWWEEDRGSLRAERHQLVFLPDSAGGPPDRTTVERIIGRDNPPYSCEFVAIRYPEGFNSRPGDGERSTLGVVTPFVSLLHGHRRQVEEAAVLSAIEAVGAASRFRQIWRDAYRQVNTFRGGAPGAGLGSQQRGDLEALADTLGNLEFDLAFSVGFPLTRVEGFRAALYEAMDLPKQAAALSQMFTQLTSSLNSEITAIDVRDARRQEARERWNHFTTNMLGIVGVLSGFVVAFLGINSGRPDGAVSLWDDSYAGVYFFLTLVVSIPVGLLVWPYLRDWPLRPGGGGGWLIGWSGLLIAVTAAVFDVLSWWPRNVGIAILMGVAGFLGLLGLSMALRTAARLRSAWPRGH